MKSQINGKMTIKTIALVLAYQVSGCVPVAQVGSNEPESEARQPPDSGSEFGFNNDVRRACDGLSDREIDAAVTVIEVDLRSGFSRQESQQEAIEICKDGNFGCLPCVLTLIGFVYDANPDFVIDARVTCLRQGYLEPQVDASLALFEEVREQGGTFLEALTVSNAICNDIDEDLLDDFGGRRIDSCFVCFHKIVEEVYE